MIKELLSTALLAVSLNTNPHRAIDTNNYGAPYGVDLTFDDLTRREFSGSFFTSQGSSVFDDVSDYSLEGGDHLPLSSGGVQEDYFYVDCSWSGSNDDFSITCYFNFYLDVRDYQDSITYLNGLVADYEVTSGNISISNLSSAVDDSYDDGDFWCYVLLLEATINTSNASQGNTFNLFFKSTNAPIYSVTKAFNNCHDSGNTSYYVPDEFTSNTLANPYTIYVLANDGYFFKRDGSSYSFSSGVVVTNVDYGANPSGEALVYSSEMKITFSMPASDVSMTFTASAITLADANALYNQGYQDAKAIYENTNQFAWMKNIWSGMAGFFAIEILPNISLGFLAFAPLLVVAIIAIVRILKHD